MKVEVAAVNTNRTGADMEISKMLTSIAGVILAGTLTFSLFALEKTEPTLIFWLVFGIGVSCIVSSIVCSGKGISRSSGNMYQWQAIFLFIGFAFFMCLLPLSWWSHKGAASAVSEDASPSSQLAALSQRWDEFDQRLSRLEAQMESQKMGVRSPQESSPANMTTTARSKESPDQE